MRDTPEQREKEYYPDTVSASPRTRRGNPFWGDSGTVFSEQARKDLEDNSSHGDEGAGHPGNNVDFSQQYAQSEADGENDWCYQEAKRIVRDFETNEPYNASYKDPEKRQEIVEQMAEKLREAFDENGRLGTHSRRKNPPKPIEQEEEPFSSDKFWSDPEELKRAGKMVRPPKL
jgi:hypothetical protein